MYAMAAPNDGPRSIFLEPAAAGERAARRFLLEITRETADLQIHYDTALLSQNPRHRRQANLSRQNLEHAVNALRTITDVPNAMTTRITAAVTAANDTLARILPFDEGDLAEVPALSSGPSGPLSPLVSGLSASGSFSAFRPIETPQDPPAPSEVIDAIQSPSIDGDQGLRFLFESPTLPATPVLRSRSGGETAPDGLNDGVMNLSPVNGENERPSSSLSSQSKNQDASLAMNSVRRERLRAKQELRKKIEKRRDELERLQLDLECAENLEVAERADEQIDSDREVAVTFGDSVDHWVTDTCARTRLSPQTQPSVGPRVMATVNTTQVHVTPTACTHTSTYTRPYTQAFSAPPVHMQPPVYAHTQMHVPPTRAPLMQPHLSQPMSAPYFPWHNIPPPALQPPTPTTTVGAGQPGLMQGDVARSLLTVNLMAHAHDLVVQSRPPAQKRFSGGNAQDFETFVNQFNKATKVEGVTDQMRFLELKHWVSGPASLVVTQYENEQNSTEALAKAIAHLKREFGRKLFTARQMLDELLAGPKLNENDNDAIQVFILKLSQVHKRAVETKREATFSTRETFDDIIRRKLPFYAHKWATKYTDSEERIVANPAQADELTFSSFLEFCRRMNKISVNKKAIFKVDSAPTASSAKTATQNTASAGNRKAKIAATDVNCNQDVNASVAATTTSKPRNNKKPSFPMKKGHGTAAQPKSYAAATKTTNGGDSSKGKPSSYPSKDTASKATGEKPCPACENGRHDLDACREFLKKDDEDRRSFVRKKGICYRCLKHGHIAADCPVDVRCSECNGKHNAVFHRTLPEKLRSENEC